MFIQILKHPTAKYENMRKIPSAILNGFPVSHNSVKSFSGAFATTLASAAFPANHENGETLVSFRKDKVFL